VPGLRSTLIVLDAPHSNFHASVVDRDCQIDGISTMSEAQPYEFADDNRRLVDQSG
jgi:hypothetical protein